VSADETARIWDAATGAELLRFSEHTLPVRACAFSPNGEWIVTGGDDRTIHPWQAASGRALRPFEGHGESIHSLVFSPDGQRILSGSEDGTARLWDTASGREILVLKGHSSAVLNAVFSRDGRRIATGGRDGTARIWETATPEQVAAWKSEEDQAAQRLAVLRRDRSAEVKRERAALASDEGRIKRWLILAPITLAAGQTATEGLDADQIGGEKDLRPAAGEKLFMSRSELAWRELILKDHDEKVIDFNEFSGRITPPSVAYAVCYIRSQIAQHGLQILVGSDDQSKIYLNGKQIYRSSVAHAFVTNQDTVAGLTLNSGLSILIFKVANESRAWAGSIRLTDADGNSLKGIQVTLSPE
jgi:hypothetical protein